VEQWCGLEQKTFIPFPSFFLKQSITKERNRAAGSGYVACWWCAHSIKKVGYSLKYILCNYNQHYIMRR